MKFSRWFTAYLQQGTLPVCSNSTGKVTACLLLDSGKCRQFFLCKMIKDRNRTPYKDHGKHRSDPDTMQPPGADQADHNRNCHVEHIKTVLRKSDTSVNTIRIFKDIAAPIPVQSRARSNTSNRCTITGAVIFPSGNAGKTDENTFKNRVNTMLSGICKISITK